MIKKFWPKASDNFGPGEKEGFNGFFFNFGSQLFLMLSNKMC